jgi:hypothetical protein
MSMHESTARRLAYRFGQAIACGLFYVAFVATSPLFGLWIVYETWTKRRPDNVVFARFGKN